MALLQKTRIINSMLQAAAETGKLQGNGGDAAGCN